MDALNTLAIVSLALTLVALVAAVALGIRLEALPRRAHRHAIDDLRAEVQRLADEHAARPTPRRRHAHRCPCGRFAQLVTEGPRATWTRCRAHGLRVREHRRIGRPETPLVRITLHRPLVDYHALTAPPVVSMLEAMRPTTRARDWLDGGQRAPLYAVAA